MIFEVWEMQTGNLLGAEEREADALALVRELVLARPPDHGGSLALLAADETGAVRTVAEGTRLAARALASRGGQPRRGVA